MNLKTEVKSLNQLVQDYARKICKVSAPGRARCGCMEKTVYGAVALFLDPDIKTALNIKEIPNAHQILKQLDCIP